jgi:hypothetical protein
VRDNELASSGKIDFIQAIAIEVSALTKGLINSFAKKKDAESSSP